MAKTTPNATMAVAVAAILALIGCSPLPVSPPAGRQVSQFFQKWAQPDSPGCSVGISRNGQLVYERGFGMSNLELRVPIAPTTAFEAASISKQFTAMSIMLLVQRGRISLDDAVQKYLPELPVYEHPLTIRHLLNHTSGLRDAFLLFELSAPEDEFGDRNDIIVKQLARQRSLNYQPGTESQYNNGGYVLLATIVKRVSGQPLAAFTNANIFTPLGMRGTAFQDDPTLLIPNRASNYVRDGGSWRLVPPGRQPGAVGNSGMWTTTRDLLQWAKNLADAKVGSKELLAQMQTPTPVAKSEGINWGLGFEISEHRGATFVGHGGGDRGIDNYVAYYPQPQLAIAVLCNTDGTASRHLTQQIADLYLPAPPSGPAIENPAPSRPAIALTPAQLEGKAGLYRETGGDTFVRTFVRDGELRGALGTGTGESFLLAPLTETRFNIMGSRFFFEFAPAGRATVLRSFADAAQTGTFDRVEPVTLTSAQLRAYAGVYASAELDAAWTIAEHGSALVIRRSGNGDAIVEPIATDVFTTIGDYMRFTRDARGAITGFTLVASGAKGLRFERVQSPLPSKP
jgi:CubicO group peptidase (beta-lactamase class C family)